MNFEPQKFFVGLVDFFAILMPGALLAYLGKNCAATVLPGHPQFRLDGAEAWMVFFFSSYILGHFAFLVGAILDGRLYERLRSSTDWGQVRRLAHGKGLSGRSWRTVSCRLFGKDADAAVMQAQRIKARALQALSAEGAINAYQWCKARLSNDHPEGLVAVQRFEADSKFFRSFSVVLAVLTPILVFSQPVLGLFCVVFLPFALWRYVDQRFKGTQHAYWFVITLEGMKSPSTPAVSPTGRLDGLTHAGGVVFRKRGEAFEYLLVQASQDHTKWVLPKGHIEAGEDPRETAVREVREETGLWAQVMPWKEDLQLSTGANSAVSRFYLMEAAEDDDVDERTKTREKWPAEGREHQWLVLADAQQRASFDETKNLLEKAEIYRKEMSDTTTS